MTRSSFPLAVDCVPNRQYLAERIVRTRSPRRGELTLNIGGES
jgi:hypothetical protein